MSRQRGRWRTAGVALVLGLGLACAAAGCGTPAPGGRVVATDQMLGEQLSSVYTMLGYDPAGALPQNLGLVLQDISPAVTNKPADPSPGTDVGEWAVLSACYQPSPGQLTLGIARTRDVPADAGVRARQRGYDRFVGGCTDAVPTFTVAPPP